MAGERRYWEFVPVNGSFQNVKSDSAKLLAFVAALNYDIRELEIRGWIA